MKKFILFLSIALILQVTLCSNEEKSDKQTKADACIKIFQSRIAQDRSYYTELLEFYSKGATHEEAENKLFTPAFLSCYQAIGYFEAEEIDSSPKIDALSQENKDLLSLEKWENLYKTGNAEQIEYEMSQLSEAFEDIKKGEIHLGRAQQHSQQRGDNNDDEFYMRSEKKVDFSLFGFNFTKMEEKYKYTLGIFLIALVFAFVIGGLKWIDSIHNEGKNKKKKKKKN